MTINEAIDLFEDNFTYIETHGHYSEKEEAQAYTMAIEALKQCADLQKALHEITELRDSWKRDCYHDEADALSTAIKIINKHIRKREIE